jgi:periplasmic protein CpxP/Spy
MTRKIVPIALSAFALTAFLAPLAEAREHRGGGEGRGAGIHAGKPGHHGHQRRGQHGPAALLRQLDLTEEQQATIRGLLEAHRAEAQGTREQHLELRRQLRELTQQTDADPTEVGRLTLELQAMRQEGRASMEALQAAIEAQLTTEQLERYQELRQERRERFEQRQERMEQRREGREEGFRAGRPGNG